MRHKRNPRNYRHIPPSRLLTLSGHVVDILSPDDSQKWLGCMLSCRGSGATSVDVDFHLQAASRAFFANKDVLYDRNILIFAPRNSLCPLQRAVLRAVSTMLSALAGGWGRSAPPTPKLDPGAVLARPPPWGAATVRPALSCRSRAGPLPTACPTTCGPRQPRHRPGGRGAPGERTS